MESEQEVLVSKVCEIYEELSKLDDLNPSKLVNSLFTKLVIACIPSCDPIDVTNTKVKEIRSKLISLCAKAEGLLESHYSTIIASYENPLSHITLFPYHSNYLKLSHIEFKMLSQNLSHQNPSKVAFVGSGPLPLSSIVLASKHLTNTAFHNYDIDAAANLKASNLVSSDADLAKRMSFHTANIIDVSDELKDYDVVFLAALVGVDKAEKARVVDHLAKNMAPGATLLVRSAHGARVFLYPVVDFCDLQGFEILSVYHPTDEVINSVIVARKKAAPLPTILPSKCSEVHGFNLIVNHGNMIEELTVDEKLA